MKYNLSVKGRMADTYNELSALYSGIDTTEINVPIESIVRHVIWFYSADNELEHIKYPDYQERYTKSIKEHSISTKHIGSPPFKMVENEIAFRYLLLQGNTKYEVWISAKIRMSNICKNLRILDEDVKWADQESSIKVIDRMLEQTLIKIEEMEKSLFGDHIGIKQFALNKEVTKIYAENYVQ